MRKVSFKKSNYSKSRNSIIILLILMVATAVVGWNVNAAGIDNKVSGASAQLQKEQTISTLLNKVEENKAKVDAIDKIKNAKQISDEELKGAVDVLFNGDKERVVKVANCENGTHVADRTYQNKKDGKVWSTDWGIMMINDFFHSKRVEKLFSIPFIKAVTDPAKNLVYSAVLHNEQGNLSAWACDSKISMGGGENQ